MQNLNSLSTSLSFFSDGLSIEQSQRTTELVLLLDQLKDVVGSFDSSLSEVITREIKGANVGFVQLQLELKEALNRAFTDLTTEVKLFGNIESTD